MVFEKTVITATYRGHKFWVGPYERNYTGTHGDLVDPGFIFCMTFENAELDTTWSYEDFWTTWDNRPALEDVQRAIGRACKSYKEALAAGTMTRRPSPSPRKARGKRLTSDPSAGDPAERQQPS